MLDNDKITTYGNYNYRVPAEEEAFNESIHAGYVQSHYMQSQISTRPMTGPAAQVLIYEEVAQHR